MEFSRGLFKICNSAKAFIRAPRLAVPLVATIALGVGSNASIYGFVQGLVHPTSPLGGADRVVSIFRQDSLADAGPLSNNDYQRLKTLHGTFNWVGVARIGPNDIRLGNHSEIATIATVTLNVAKALRLPLSNGIVVSHHFWQTTLDGKAAVQGDLIYLNNGAALQIKGIAAEWLEGLYRDHPVDVWMPMEEGTLQGKDKNKRDLWVLANLRPGVSVDEAEMEVHLTLARSGNFNVILFTGTQPRMARGLARIGILLNLAAGAVFLIAVINVASFLLGRALRRSNETSLRIALGATRAELVWQLLSDSIVISIAGGIFGMFLAVCTVRVIPAFLFEGDAERLVFAPHLLPLLLVSTVCVAITTVCGMMPVVATITDRPWTVLKRESGFPSKTMARLRTALVVGQISMCCVLVFFTALLLESLHSALKTSAGQGLGDPILATVQAQAQTEVDTKYFVNVEQSANLAPILSPLAWTARLPGNQPVWRSFRIQPPSSQSRELKMDIVTFTPESLNFIDRQPVAGRLFGINDQTCKVAIVDEAAADQLFNRDTVGRTIEDPNGLPVEIIGVVKRHSNVSSNGRRPIIYYSSDDSGAPAPSSQAPFRVPVSETLADAELSVNTVSPGYFGALGVSLVAGQLFSEHPMSGQCRVGVINQEAADLYFGGKPLGASVIDEGGIRTSIIGIVRSRAFGMFQQHAEPTLYLPMWQDCPFRMTLILKASEWNSRMMADLRRRIISVPGADPGPPVIRTMNDQLSQSALAPLRIATLILGASASIALLLSVLGLLSAQSDAEHQRRPELALCIALGAQRWRIVCKTLEASGQAAIWGCMIGSLIALALLRILKSDIALISAPPLWVWLLAPTAPFLVVVITSILPAHRASVIDPLTIMRDDH